ncbi:MAG: hypothetical protein ACHQ3P_08250 [Candidatus Limnocylindrales bacterium]
MSRISFVLAAVAISVTVLAGSSDPDGWRGGSAAVTVAGSAAVTVAGSAVDVSGAGDARHPVGRRWASVRDEGRRWSVALEPHGRRWRSG